MRTHMLVLAAAPLALLAATAAPAVADTPTPVTGTPACKGQIVATFNHGSGAAGPSGNPRSSAGPGSFLHQQTAAAVAGARADNC